MLKRSIIALAGIALLALSSSAAHAQANLTFSGGNYTPVTLTIASPITFTVTAASTRLIGFVFDETGNGEIAFAATTGTITFSKNGGAPQTIDLIGSGDSFTANDITVNDTYLTGESASAAQVGDIFVLSSGTLTSNSYIVGAAPRSGIFTTFMTNDQGKRVSSNGITVVPEANTAALAGLVLPMVGAMAAFHHRKKK